LVLAFEEPSLLMNVPAPCGWPGCEPATHQHEEDQPEQHRVAGCIANYSTTSKRWHLVLAAVPVDDVDGKGGLAGHTVQQVITPSLVKNLSLSQRLRPKNRC
jgi:hypothetical protein